jgi:DNA-directed RNA polymerase specialized sigma subunit
MTKVKTRRKRTKNDYFTKLHEEAIIKYVSSNCQKERSQLYIEWIGPAFNDLVDKIVFTYKFNNLPNIEPLRDECKVWLTTILNKYNPNKGSKAFSYFSVVTKNWFIHQFKKNSNKIKKEVSFEDLVENGGPNVLGTSDNKEKSYHQLREEKEFWLMLLANLNKWNSPNLKENEKKVIEAVKILCESVDDLEILNKKAVYLYLREITGLNTKQVVSNLNKIREKYKIFKGKWNSGSL